MRFWASKNESSSPHKLSVEQVAFICEQDGDPERERKGKLVGRFLDNRDLNEAFLVRVRYAPEHGGVALCLFARQQDEDLVNDAASEFRTLFGADVSLDIMFVTKQQRRQLVLVAKPFYARTGQQP
jgi:hypothetical protein